MPNTTARLALTQPIGADAPSELRVSITNSTGILDSAAMYQSGTLSSRPATPVAGTFYFGTDTSTLYCYDGTEWLLAGVKDTGWTAPSYSANWADDSGTPVGWRAQGDRVYLKGWVQNTAGTTQGGGTTIFNIPAPYRPANGISFDLGGGASAPLCTPTILTNGNVTTQIAVGASGIVSLQSKWYSLT